MPMLRLVFASLALVLVGAAPSAAHAQQTGGVQYGTLSIEVRDGEGDLVNTVDRDRFFNRARCECETPVILRLRLDGAQPNLPDEDLQVWSGSACAEDSTTTAERAENCRLLGTVRLGALERSREVDLTLDARQLSLIKGDCDQTGTQTERTAKIVLFVDDEGDFKDVSRVGELSLPIDFSAPERPEGLTVTGGEDQFTVSWEFNENEDDLLEVYVLCRDQDGNPIRASGPDVSYETPDLLCGEQEKPARFHPHPPADEVYVPHQQSDASVDASGDASGPDASESPDASNAPDGGDASGPDGADPGANLGDFGGLDPRFVCARGAAGVSSIDVDRGTASDTDVVTFGVVFVDNHKNPALFFPDPASSSLSPVVDFWEYYGQQGGQAQGGFCSVAAGQTGQLAWLMGGLFLVVGALLLVTRRGPGSMLVVLLASGTLLGSAPSAHAQIILEDEAWNPSQSKWAFELKFGPYLPDIDSAFATATPYADTFGGASLLSAVELDRFFAWPAGHLGVAGQLGFFRRSAPAFEQDGAGKAVMDMRSDSDETSLTLVPTSLSAVYRMTALADRTPVPLVPFAKAGVSYYLWWIDKGNGDTAETMQNGKARGGTWGWQASLGLALRLGFLDPDAQGKLDSDFGVQHTTLFGEVLTASIDGFGDDQRLRLGDLTWLLGLGFVF